MVFAMTVRKKSTLNFTLKWRRKRRRHDRPVVEQPVGPAASIERVLARYDRPRPSGNGDAPAAAKVNVTKDVDVCGKTGTVQTIGRDTRSRLSEEEAEKFAPNAWFVGFAPKQEPEIVVAVLIQRGVSGSASAAPIAGKIFELYHQKRARELVAAEATDTEPGSRHPDSQAATGSDERPGDS